MNSRVAIAYWQRQAELERQLEARLISQGATQNEIDHKLDESYRDALDAFQHRPPEPSPSMSHCTGPGSARLGAMHVGLFIQSHGMPRIMRN